MSRLKEIVVGDLVVVHAPGRVRGNDLGRHRYLATVARVTATQVVIDDVHRTRFMRSTGSEYGGDFYDGKWVEPATPELAEQVRAEHRHHELEAATSSTDKG